MAAGRSGLRFVGVDTGLAAFVRFQRSATDAVGDGLASVGDAADTGASVAIPVALILAGVFLLLGDFCQHRGGAQPAPVVPQAGGPPVVDVHGTPLAPARNDPYQGGNGLGMGSSPSHNSGLPVAGSPMAPMGLQVLQSDGSNAMPVEGSPLQHAVVQDERKVQVGLYYLANVGPEQKVVKVNQVNAAQGMVEVKETAMNMARNGYPVFKVTGLVYQLPIANLLQGPFAMTAGRAPQQVSQLFAKGHPSAQQPPLPSPARPARTATQAGFQNRCDDALSQPQYRYMGALRKMEELGFADNPEMRDVLNAYGGNVNEALREFWK